MRTIIRERNFLFLFYNVRDSIDKSVDILRHYEHKIKHIYHTIMYRKTGVHYIPNGISIMESYGKLFEI